MSQPKVLGPAITTGGVLAALPVTGSPVVLTALIGLGLVITGLLLLRSSRVRRDHHLRHRRHQPHQRRTRDGTEATQP